MSPVAQWRVDRQKDHIERAVPVRDPPPRSMEESVSPMKDPAASAFHNPTELRIAEAIDRW